jgi:signal transduction histidine kinase
MRTAGICFLFGGHCEVNAGLGVFFGSTSSPVISQPGWFFLLCTVLIFCVLWLFHLLRLRKATTQVREHLSERLEERERIIYESHDGLLQDIQGLMLRFDAVSKRIAEDDPAHKLLEGALERGEELLREGRERVRGLYDEQATADDLAEELTRYGKTHAEAASFSLTVLGAPRIVRAEVHDEAYQIGRDALVNALQNARAGKIEAEIIYRPDSLALRVRDDGKGIGSENLRNQRRSHSTLFSMQKRAAKIGGRLDVWSQVGRGTEVDLTIPAKVAYSRRPVPPVWQRMKRIMGEIAGLTGG